MHHSSYLIYVNGTPQKIIIMIKVADIILHNTETT